MPSRIEAVTVNYAELLCQLDHNASPLCQSAATAIRKLLSGGDGSVIAKGEIVLPLDGRMPIIAGKPLDLPRRELSILAALMHRYGAYVNKAQLHYLVFDKDSEAQLTLVETHISRLRKRLKERLGYDPIETERYIGYRIGGKR